MYWICIQTIFYFSQYIFCMYWGILNQNMMWSYVIKSVCIGGMCWSSMLWEYVMRPINMLWGYNICFEDMSWKSMSWEYVLRKHNVFWVYVLNPICFGSMFSNTPCMYWEKRICFGYMCWILYVLEVCFGIQGICIEGLMYMFWKYVSVSMHWHM